MTNKEKREYLMQYQELWKEADILREKIEVLRSRAEKITPLLSASPGGGSGSDFTFLVDKRLELEEKLEKKLVEASLKHIEIENVISRVETPLHRHILEKRYINGISLKNIAEYYNYSYDRIRHLHGEALEFLKVDT